MDLGVRLESPQRSQSSSRVGACTCAFFPRFSSSVTLPFAWIKGSVAFPRGFSRLITPNLWNFQRVLHTIAATQEVPRHTRLHSRASTRFPPTSRGDPFPTPSSRGGILSLRGGERISRVPVASQEEALSTGKARGTPGSCHHSQSPPDVSVHSRETCFP